MDEMQISDHRYRYYWTEYCRPISLRHGMSARLRGLSQNRLTGEALMIIMFIISPNQMRTMVLVYLHK
jgi:hypothetical protein